MSLDIFNRESISSTDSIISVNDIYNNKGTDHLGKLSIDRKTLQWISNRAWVGFNWLMMEFSGWLL
jgi:hypothetical protein